MEKIVNYNILSKKDARITILSMIVVCLIFSTQIFFFYRLYESNIDLLQRELNLATDESYKGDLNRRLEKSFSKPSLEYFGPNKPDAVTDTTNVTIIDSKGAWDSKGGVVTMTAAMEEYVSRYVPIHLATLDSLSGVTFKSRGIANSFYSEIIDIETDKVLETTKKPDTKPWQILTSNEIPVNAAQTKVLRITLINPMSSFYVQTGIMFVLSFLLCIICLYSFYVHQRTLARQKEVSKLKNDLFADISHEFNRPLHSLTLMISSMENDKLMEDPEKKARYIRLGKREVNKMNNQREMILSMTKDDEGFLELNYTDFDLAEAITESARFYQDIAEKPEELDIEIVNEIPDNSIVRADKDHIALVISNLIENAVKYSKAPTKININLYRDNNSVCFSVSDNGIGISEENLSMIFERFSRVQSSETNAKGYGIGLNYVKRIVEIHHGQVVVTSKPGEGSRFLIIIPQ